MACAQCGAELGSGAAFCGSCGTPVAGSAATGAGTGAALVVSMQDEAPVATGTDQIVLTIGDIGVSQHWVVTPNGTAPLAGSTWIARDMSRTESKIPSWAIILAIVFALLCLVGLLFLLVKEHTTTGYVEVSVQQGQLYHVTQIPVSSAQQLAQVRQQVYQAQSMAAAAG
jgi:hypothetical protein